MSQYKIRADYISNQALGNTTYSADQSNYYWTPGRIRENHVFQWAVYRTVARQVGPSDTVVDVGCGAATKFSKLIGAKTDTIIGIDQPSAITYCREAHAAGTWWEANLEEEPNPAVPRGIADVVMCVDAIEHMANPEALLNWIRHLSNSHTRIYVSTPDRDRLRGRSAVTCPNPSHVREWNAREFVEFLDSEGFEVVQQLHLVPFRLRPATMRRSLKVLLKQARLRDGRRFRYSQLVECRLA